MIKLVKLLRLSRIARMARLMRCMPELMVLIKGMATATRSVLFTLLLLGVNVYIFAIAFVQLLMETQVGQEHFNTVPKAMYTLIVRGALMDNIGAISDTIGDESIIIGMLFYVFVLVASLTILNMLIGVLCEVVSAVASVEKEAMTISMVKSQLMKVVEEIDENGSMTISKDEFLQILEVPRAAAHLSAVGVDVVGLVDFADFIFDRSDEGDDDSVQKEVELTFTEFMEIILSLRGSNNAMVKDVVDLRKMVKNEQAKIHRHISKNDDRIGRIEVQVAETANSVKLFGAQLNRIEAMLDGSARGKHGVDARVDKLRQHARTLKTSPRPGLAVAAVDKTEVLK